MLIVIIVLLVCGIVGALFIGAEIRNKDFAKLFFLSTGVLGVIALGAFLAYDFGVGRLRIDNPDPNSLYEFVSSIGVENHDSTKYAVILQKVKEIVLDKGGQERSLVIKKKGPLKAYLLDESKDLSNLSKVTVREIAQWEIANSDFEVAASN